MFFCCFSVVFQCFWKWTHCVCVCLLLCGLLSIRWKCALPLLSVYPFIHLFISAFLHFHISTCCIVAHLFPIQFIRDREDKREGKKMEVMLMPRINQSTCCWARDLPCFTNVHCILHLNLIVITSFLMPNWPITDLSPSIRFDQSKYLSFNLNF